MTSRYALKWVTCSGKYMTSKSFPFRSEAEAFKASLEKNSNRAYRVVEIKVKG